MICPICHQPQVVRLDQPPGNPTSLGPHLEEAHQAELAELYARCNLCWEEMYNVGGGGDVRLAVVAGPLVEHWGECGGFETHLLKLVLENRRR